MSKKIVHIVGTGTIGEPLIGLLCDYKEQLGIDQVTFHKNTPLKDDRSKVIGLLKRGARISINEDKITGFKELGIESDLSAEEAISRASVVIDCTPSGIGTINKESFYKKFLKDVKGFIAQGSEDGFGMKYARGINDKIMKANTDNQFIQVVSCNTHNISCITNTIAIKEEGPDNLEEGRFMCIRRANDTSQVGSFIAAPSVGSHAMKINSQYMHVLWFYLKTKEPLTLNDVKDRLHKNDLVAMTSKNMTSTVFSFGRDHGHFGRILNQTVVVEQSLHVKNNHEVYGYCFTPQDGNSILSSISATEHFLYPHSFEDKVQCLGELFFDEI